MTAFQDNIFSAGESDAWFRRNRAALEDGARADPVLDALRQHVLAHQPASVLDVGCSNGWRLARLARLAPLVGGARLAGLDPSGEAIAAGRRRHKEFDLRQALASAIPFTGQFALVIVSFVLHWIDRASLGGSVAAIDRAVAPGGFLVIADFDPDQPERRRYHHRDDVEIYTFKQDYAALFLADGNYSETQRRVYQAGGGLLPAAERLSLASDERCFVSVLRKQGGGASTP